MSKAHRIRLTWSPKAQRPWCPGATRPAPAAAVPVGWTSFLRMQDVVQKLWSKQREALRAERQGEILPAGGSEDGPAEG